MLTAVRARERANDSELQPWGNAADRVFLPGRVDHPSIADPPARHTLSIQTPAVPAVRPPPAQEARRPRPAAVRGSRFGSGGFEGRLCRRRSLPEGRGPACWGARSAHARLERRKPTVGSAACPGGGRRARPPLARERRRGRAGPTGGAGGAGTGTGIGISSGTAPPRRAGSCRASSIPAPPLQRCCCLCRELGREALGRTAGYLPSCEVRKRCCRFMQVQGAGFPVKEEEGVRWY